jgi:hypothetical protein
MAPGTLLVTNVWTLLSSTMLNGAPVMHLPPQSMLVFLAENLRPGSIRVIFQGRLGNLAYNPTSTDLERC